MVCSVNGDCCRRCQDAAGVKKKKTYLRCSHRPCCCWGCWPRPSSSSSSLVVLATAAVARTLQVQKKNLLSPLLLSTLGALVTVVVVVPGSAGHGRHRRHRWWWCWWPPSTLGSLGWGCRASLLSSTLGMGVDTDVENTKDKSVSWVYATGGAHLSWPSSSSSTALRPVHDVHSWDFENFQSVVITNHWICNHSTSNFLKSQDSATTKRR